MAIRQFNKTVLFLPIWKFLRTYWQPDSSLSFISSTTRSLDILVFTPKMREIFPFYVRTATALSLPSPGEIEGSGETVESRQLFPYVAFSQPGSHLTHAHLQLQSILLPKITKGLALKCKSPMQLPLVHFKTY